MAPMTRSRAIGNLPNSLMAAYYGQRTGAGLIITEGTAPSADALGYPRIPGIFSRQQIDGWKMVTKNVHKAGSKIFLQLMHTGRIGHLDNLPENTTLVGASSRKAAGQIFTDTKGMQDHSEPEALSAEGIENLITSFVTAAKNAISAGFDGVELHGANGYLLEQFLNPNVNTREDAYGGSVENRARFALEVTRAVADAIGRDKVGIRLSPFSTLGDLAPYDQNETHDTYALLAEGFAEIGILYIHLAFNATIPQRTLQLFQERFQGILIRSTGLTPQTAEEVLQNGSADLVAFGRAFLANPDFIERIESGAALNPVDFPTLYSSGATGYTDYPVLSVEA